MIVSPTSPTTKLLAIQLQLHCLLCFQGHAMYDTLVLLYFLISFC